MTKAHKSHASAQYRIKLKERLGDKWSDWFEQMAISTEAGQTILTGSSSKGAGAFLWQVVSAEYAAGLSRSIEFYLRNRTELLRKRIKEDRSYFVM